MLRVRTERHRYLVCTLALLLGCITTVSSSNTDICSPDSDSHTPHQADERDKFSTAAHEGGDAASGPTITSNSLEQQLRSQRVLLDILGNVTSATISAAAALDLLKDVAALRASSKHGAAANRWHQLKAKAQQHKDPTRGILIVAGGKDQFMNAHILLQLLRHPKINCQLPAELVYYGAREYSALVADAIAAHATATGTTVALIDGTKVLITMDTEPHKPLKHITGFKAKVHALTFVTSFDEVLLLDSDNTPMADPTYLFDSEAYMTHGNIFWLDFWTNQWMKPVIYSILGLEVPWEVDPGFRASEAGQLVINRVLHYDVLEYLYLLNLHSNSGLPGAPNSVVGSCLWGDKDTYPLAFSLAGKAKLVYNVQHKPMQALAQLGSRYVHAGMVQRGLYGELLFLHRTAAGKLWPHCAVHGGSTCVIFGITTPVDQQQLVASVPDVTMMEFGIHNLDLSWQKRHCCGDVQYTIAGGSCSMQGASTGATAAAADTTVAGGAGMQENNQSDQSVDSSAEKRQTCGSSSSAIMALGHLSGRTATTLACDLQDSIGKLPIPVISADKLPQQVQDLTELTYELFLDSLQLARNQM